MGADDSPHQFVVRIKQHDVCNVLPQNLADSAPWETGIRGAVTKCPNWLLMFLGRLVGKERPEGHCSLLEFLFLRRIMKDILLF